MIRKFELKDLVSFGPNQYSNAGQNRDFVNDPLFSKFTLEIDGAAQCIIFYRQIVAGDYAMFLLMSRDFKAIYAKQVKLFLEETAERLNPVRLITYSENCEALNKWHGFLGFKLRQSNYIHMNNKDFNYWERLWAGKQQY